MKVLVVCSGNATNLSFVEEQIDAISKYNVVFDYFLIQGNGIKGYVKSRKYLLAKIKQFQPDLIHAHYGLSGLLANLQRKVKVITTYHGSDIHQHKNLKFSKLSILLSAQNIFVSEKIKKIANAKTGIVIPCGIDLSVFYVRDRKTCREKFNFIDDKKYILFSSSFDNTIKNYPFAKSIVDSLDSNFVLLELKGYSRVEVSQLLNAVDLALLTSFDEGSPQFVKEAVACGCPIVSINVGDVKKQLNNIPNALVINEYDQNEFIKAIYNIISKRSESALTVENSIWDNNFIAKKILAEYKRILRTD